MAFSVRAPNLEHRPQDNHPFFETQPNAQHTQARSFRPAELTAWRTSIVAVPLVYEGPWSASTLGIDFCEDTEQLAAARAKAIAAILARGPDKALAYKLVAAYFEEIDWCHVVFHRKSFEAELDRMWEMVEEGRSGEIDPMWLACYFMVRAACSALSPRTALQYAQASGCSRRRDRRCCVSHSAGCGVRSRKWCSRPTSACTATRIPGSP